MFGGRREALEFIGNKRTYGRTDTQLYILVQSTDGNDADAYNE